MTPTSYATKEEAEHDAYTTSIVLQDVVMDVVRDDKGRWWTGENAYHRGEWRIFFNCGRKYVWDKGHWKKVPYP